LPTCGIVEFIPEVAVTACGQQVKSECSRCECGDECCDAYRRSTCRHHSLEHRRLETKAVHDYFRLSPRKRFCLVLASTHPEFDLLSLTHSCRIVPARLPPAWNASGRLQYSATFGAQNC